MTIILIQFSGLLIKSSIINIAKLYVFLLKGAHTCINIFPHTSCLEAVKEIYFTILLSAISFILL